MIRYVIPNLSPSTSAAEQEKLIAAFSQVKGVKDVAVAVARKEVTFSITGAEPRKSLLEEACKQAGFTLGNRM